MNSRNFKIFKSTYHSILALIGLTSVAFPSHALQDSSEDEALARMQAQLNGEVMSRPFLAESF